MICECTCPHHTECSAVFDQKIARPPCSTLSTDLPLSDFLSFPDEKSPQRETFAHVEEVNQKKMAETLKGIKIDKFKNYFEQWKKNISIGVLHQMDSILKVTDV